MLRRLNSRTFQIGALGAALVLSAKPGASEPSKAKVKACGLTYRSAVQLEMSGHLRQARDVFLSCAKVTCGAVIKQRCSAHYTQLEEDTPSVVPLVTDESGDPRVDVQVTMDNELLASRLDGRALQVDPGLHEFSFSADGAVIASQKVMIVQGQRNRPLNVAMKGGDKRGKKAVLGTAAPAGGLDAKASLEKAAVDREPMEKPEREAPLPDKSASSEKASSDKTSSDSNASDAPTLETKSKGGGPGAAPYLIGVVGLAGLGAYGAFTYWGRKDNELLGNCAPNCQPGSVDHIRKLYLAADISVGVGAAALATSLIWFIASPSSKEKPPSQASYRFDVQPSSSGGYATVSGSF
jgi:hypothetical protein